MAERNLDFDTVVDRRNTKSLKYDFAGAFGMPEGLLPLWVADMDFKTSSYVEDALAECAAKGIFGYSEVSTPYFETVRGWMQRRHGWNVEEEWLIKTPGVVFALAMTVKAYTKPGDAVLVQLPVYYPFAQIIRDNGRRVVSSDLYLGEDNRYHMDFDDFEQKIRNGQVKLFLLCSPHNPVGRTWTREELVRIGEICLAHGVIVVSDEIHHDFIFQGEHHVFADLKEEFAQNSITCTAPSKTFNLAGMVMSNIFIPNPQLRKKFKKEMDAAGMSQLGIMGLAACEAAYAHGDVWYEAMHAYVRDNIAFARELTQTQLPGVRMTEHEATYLIWLDFRETGLSDGELDERIIKRAGLWLDSGRMFGAGGSGFQRINVACPRSILEQAFERLKLVLV
ncbi:MalY/PatB family protein [Lachnospiraceae bacterium 47-T17]